MSIISQPKLKSFFEDHKLGRTALSVSEKNDLALAYEVFQTAILVHDDIIDRDTVRRGKDTIHHANYKKYKNSYSIPYIYGKMYTLSDGTPIVFYEDEIQIGFDSYKYADFSDFNFLKSLSTNTKKTIINIYTNGAANININLL